MGDKLKKRANLYTSFDDFKAIDKKHLPKEYGGTVPMKEMIGNTKRLKPTNGNEDQNLFLITDSMKKELLENHEFHLRYNELKVNCDMYPKQVLDGSVKSLKYLLNSPELYEKMKIQDIYGVQGSFRKLEID